MSVVSDKSAVLESYLLEYKLDGLIETGLYCGGGSGMALVRSGRLARERYLVIDAGRENVKLARAWDFSALEGDSAVVLPAVLPLLDGPLLFWLDAHYVTAFDDAPKGWPSPCPLLAELAAIRDWRHGPASVVLVDDLRLVGGEGWPTRADLEALSLAAVWSVEERDDILRLTPKGPA